MLKKKEKSLKFRQNMFYNIKSLSISDFYRIFLEYARCPVNRLDSSVEQHVGIALGGLHTFMAKQFADEFQILACGQGQRGESVT